MEPLLDDPRKSQPTALATLSLARHLRVSCALLVFFTLLTGVAYPLAVTLLARLAFSEQANGSQIRDELRVLGARNIGQSFSGVGEFWGRPSASAPVPYATLPAGGSNAGPLDATMLTRVAERVALLRSHDPTNTSPIPIDLVTASGSGVDPHISVAAARWQIARVARELGVEHASIERLVDQAIEERQFGVLGERRVNVLLLNHAVRTLATASGGAK